MARLPTSAGQPSRARVPVPRIVAPSMRNPGLEAAIDVVNRLGDLAWDRMVNTAEVKGKTEGAQAGGQFNELGEPIAPNLEEIDRATPYGAAFFQSAGELYLQNMRNAGRARFARMVSEARGNKDKYDELALPYIEGAVENVPEELLPFVQSDLRDMYDLGAVDVMEEGNTRANKASIAQYGADRDASLREAEKFILLGQPHKADAIVERLTERARSMVSAGLLTQGEASIQLRQATDRLMAFTAVTEVRSALGKNDLPQALKAIDAIRNNLNLPTEVRDSALSAAQSELGIWTSHRNLKSTQAAQGRKIAHDAYKVRWMQEYIAKRDYPKSPEELMDDITKGKVDFTWGASQLRQMIGDEKKAEEAIFKTNSRRTLNEYRYGPRTHLTAEQLQTLTPEDLDTYYAAHQKDLDQQLDTFQKLNVAEIEIMVEHATQLVDPTAFEAEMARRVDNGDMTALQAADLSKKFYKRLDVLAKENAGQARMRALREAGLGHEATQTEVNDYTRELGLMVSNPRHHNSLYMVTSETGLLPENVKRAFSTLGHMKDEKSAVSALNLFTYFHQNDMTRAAMIKAVGEPTVDALESTLGLYRETRSIKEAQKKYIDLTKGVTDSSSAARREVAAWPSEDVAERFDYMIDQTYELLQENQGWLDERLYSSLGWGNKHLADVVNAHRLTGADFDKDITAFPPGMWEEIYDEVNELLRLGPAHGGVSTLQNAIPMALNTVVNRWSPEYRPDDFQAGGDAVDWQRHGIGIGSNLESTPAHIRSIWNPNIPRVDVQAKLFAAGAPLPEGHQLWQEVDIRFIPIESTIGDPSGTSYEVKYVDQEGTYQQILVAVPGQNELVPLAYKWDYETSIWRAASEEWVKSGRDAGLLEGMSRMARGDSQGFLGLFERAEGWFDTFFNTAGPVREAHEFYRDESWYEFVRDVFSFGRKGAERRYRVLVDERGRLITDAPDSVTEKYGLQNFATFNLQ